jgi:hypothetical protein
MSDPVTSDKRTGTDDGGSDKSQSNKLLMSYALVFGPLIGYSFGGIVLGDSASGATIGLLVAVVVVSVFTDQIRSFLKLDDSDSDV